MLDEALAAAERLARHDHLVIVASDFDGVTDETTRRITRLARHNDVLAVPVLDPSHEQLPASGRLVIGEGPAQVEIDLGAQETRRRLAEFASERLAPVLAWTSNLGIPVLPLSTAEETLDGIARLLGRSPGGARR